MILQALVKYYQTLLKRGEVEESGWCKARVSAEIILNDTGELQGILSLQNPVQRGKKQVFVDTMMRVPEIFKRSSGVRPNFLCDNSSYFFGIDDKGKPKRSLECFEASKKFHHDLLDGCQSTAAQAILAFFDRWQPDEGKQNTVFSQNHDVIIEASNLVFKINDRFAQDDPAIQKCWQKYKQSGQSGSLREQCLVTGEIAEIAKVHPNIKGIKDAQSSGASLISFNASSMESFGHIGDQGFNAPVSEYAAFAYAAALNELLRKGNSILCGDTTVVFWAQSGEDMYSRYYSALMGGSDASGLSDEDIKAVLEKTAKGNPADLKGIVLSPDEPFYVLGLAPNAARLSVRFFWRNTFGTALKNIHAHQERMKICRPSWENESLSLYRLLNASVNPNSKKSNASPLLAGSLLRSVLQDSPYPEAMYRQFLLRIKADSDKINEKGRRVNLKITYPRAAFIKAYLIKNHEKEWGGEITMKVNENCNAIPYVLGRLFAVLEGLQQTVNPGINATIKDRYFNAACATPGTVFPLLLKLSNAHLNKLGKDKKAWAITIQKKIGDLLGKISMPDQGSPIPGRLTLDEQGMFILGYYQETQDRFTKKEDKE